MSSTLDISEPFLWNLSEKGALSSVKELFDSVVIFADPRRSLRAWDLNDDLAAFLVDDHGAGNVIEWFHSPAAVNSTERICVPSNSFEI